MGGMDGVPDAFLVFWTEIARLLGAADPSAVARAVMDEEGTAMPNRESAGAIIGRITALSLSEEAL